MKPSSAPSLIATPPSEFDGKPHVQYAWFCGRRDALDHNDQCSFDSPDSIAAWRLGYESRKAES